MILAPPGAERELLDLTIRFSASLPDLLLSVPEPTVSTTSTLKQLIRTHLPAELSNQRIRLIYAGKSLADAASLSSSLKVPSSRTPSRPSTPLPDHSTFPASAKGKTPIRDPPSLSRIYIHCSIGDVTLSAQDIADEARLATRNNASSTPKEASFPDAPASSTTIPAPRGFDRLLNTGFTLPEIQSLRSQFLAIQAHTHTSTEMPSPTTLRALEDQWLDNSNEESAADGGSGGFVDDEGQAGALDDMLWGAVMGFFWPMGCLSWLCREEGVWSRRRKVAVVIGVVVNAGFGGIRWLK
jgi:iron-sulfur cluster assembly 1